MPTFLRLPFALVLLLTACTTRKKSDNIPPPAEQPAALQEHSPSYDVISKRSGDDLAEALYQEAVEKSPELKSLEKDIKSVNEKNTDSLHDWYFFKGRNQSYYDAAERHVNSISDSTVKKLLLDKVKKSKEQFTILARPYQSLEDQLSAKQKQLNDLHEVLILQFSLKAMEEYQKNLAPRRPIENANKDLDQLLKRAHEITDQQIP